MCRKFSAGRSGRQEIKEAVQKYGAVQTSLYMSRETVLPETGYYNEWTAAYYDPQEETQNHEILILGWDDSFSRFLFAQTPDQDGAFICQNSWGEDFGDQGIFYVSYGGRKYCQNGDGIHKDRTGR